jgi:hypothetical protein
MHRRAAVAVARWAQERVPLYRELYHGLPPVQTWTEFRRLPALTAARLRAASLLEQIDTPDDTLRTFTPYRLHSLPVPAATVADRDDTDALYEAWQEALTLMGVRSGMTLVILSPPEQRYVAAELAEMAGFYRVRTHVLTTWREPADVSVLAPDALLTLARWLPAGSGHAACASLRITVRDPVGAGPDLYLVPEAGVVAVRPTGAGAYTVLRRFFALESGRDGRLLLTTLRRYHQPLVRYLLPDRGRVTRSRRADLLELWEVAP